MIENIFDKLGLDNIGGGLVASKLIDYVMPFGKTPQGKLFKAQQKQQNELEDRRMNFQLELEGRRLRCQKQIADNQMQLQKYLYDKQIEANRELALFQVRAMKQTQILLAQQQAQNVLQDHLLMDALRTFPLNVSPLVLLKNQLQSTGHLLAFSDSGEKDKPSIEMVYEEVEAMRNRPDALNIFVAPVHIDSKIKNRKTLSDQIWDTVYQKIESFFTREYNRCSDHPVIFFPTAWNDKYNPGMHAAETLHFFLKDLPCVVIEPRFDGNTFRMVFSAWGLGYNNNIHHRTELSFPINIDAVLACSVYDRSLKALDAIKEIENTLKINEYGFSSKKEELERNVTLFQALHIDERIIENRMQEIDALGIYNIFKIEPTQDLGRLADFLSAQIGINLALLADIHHLRSYDRDPLLPGRLQKYFPSLYTDIQLREQLFKQYEDAYIQLRREEEEFNAMKEVRKLQILNCKELLELSQHAETLKSYTEEVLNYVKKRYNMECSTLKDAIVNTMGLWNSEDIPFFENLLKLHEIKKDRKLFLRITARFFDLQQSKKN